MHSLTGLRSVKVKIVDRSVSTMAVSVTEIPERTSSIGRVKMMMFPVEERRKSATEVSASAIKAVPLAPAHGDVANKCAKPRCPVFNQRNMRFPTA